MKNRFEPTSHIWHSKMTIFEFCVIRQKHVLRNSQGLKCLVWSFQDQGKFKVCHAVESGPHGSVFRVVLFNLSIYILRSCACCVSALSVDSSHARDTTHDARTKQERERSQLCSVSHVGKFCRILSNGPRCRLVPDSMKTKAFLKGSSSPRNDMCGAKWHAGS